MVKRGSIGISTIGNQKFYMQQEIKNIADFDTKVKRKTLSLRTKNNISNPTQPLMWRSDYYKLDNRLYSRLRVVLHSNGCSLALCTMCPLPNEASDPNVINITTDNYISQVKLALKEYSRHEIIAVYCENFFSEVEIPKKARQEILGLVKTSQCKYLFVSVHPIFITREKLQEAKSILGDQIKLLVGVGLQSANDEIRKVCVRTPLTKEVFIRAHHMIQEFGYNTKCYILLKPPFLLQEEAIKDTVESVIWAHEQGVADITICPLRVPKGTVVRDLFEKKLFSPPKLATLVESLYQLQQRGVNVRVSIGKDDSEELDTIIPSGCKICEEKILRGLLEYNSLIPVDFANLRCNYCLEEEKKHDPKEFYNLSYKERVAYWLAS